MATQYADTDRNRNPKCRKCTVDKKKCTLGLDAPAHSSCQRCLKLKQVCFVELIPVPKKKHNTELCQECRRSKQACIFPYGPYPAKCYNCAIRGLNCSEPKKANAPQPKQHAPPPQIIGRPEHSDPSHDGHNSS